MSYERDLYCKDKTTVNWDALYSTQYIGELAKKSGEIEDG